MLGSGMEPGLHETYERLDEVLAAGSGHGAYTFSV